jgi:hypothetical protein
VTDSGWFADPGGKANTFRWWNGEAWTRWLSADPTAPDPAPGSRPAAPATAPAVVDTMPRPTDAPDLAALPPPNPADRVVRLPAAAAIIAAVVLLSLIVVGAIVSFTADRPLTGPPIAPPPRQAISKTGYDPVSRKVSLEEMQFTAPNAPFSCDPQPQDRAASPSALTCTAVVHRNYDKKKHNWAAVVSMGPVQQRLTQSGDLGIIASQAFRAILNWDYVSTKVTVKKRQLQRLTGVAPDGKAVLLSADVHVSEPGLRTKYDRLVLVVVELQSGRYAAWYAGRPNDSPNDVRKALEASASTVTAR